MAYNTKSYRALFATVLEETGHPHSAILSKPEPSTEDDVYYDGFCILGSRRIYSQVGPQPIAFTEILAYLNELGTTDPDERESFIEIMTFLDVIEMNHITLKASKK